MKMLLRILLAPYKAWAKAYDKTISEVMEMEEPHRSWLLRDILYGGIHNDRN